MILSRFARRSRVLFVGAILSCLVILTHTASLAQGPVEWSRAIPISGALAGSRYPSLVAQDDGTLYLFWGFAPPGEKSTIFVSKHTENAWLRPVDVLLGGPRPQASIDGRDTIHILLPKGDNLSIVSANAVEANTLRGWTTLTTLSRAGANGIADYSFGADDVLYAVWLEKLEGCENCYGVGFEKQGQDFDPSLSYRVLADQVKTKQPFIQLVSAGTENLYALWGTPPEKQNKAGIGLSLSHDKGETWSTEPLSLSFPNDDILQPLLIRDQKNQLVLVFNYGVKDEVYYTVSSDEGVTWAEPSPIPKLFASKQIPPDNYFAAATDSSGIVHLIAAGRAAKDQNEPGLYHLTWDGTTWNDFQEIYRGNTTVEYPNLTIANGNQLHVSFATRDRNPVGADAEATYQVWYTNAQTNAPAATRVPLPTFTPTPVPTATPVATLTPAPTATPTLGLENPPTPNSSENRTDPQQPIILTVVLIVSILALVIVVNMLLRRRG